MRAKSFHSKLEPHFDFILAQRRQRKSWQEVVDALVERGVKTTKQTVHGFMKRRLKRRYALGMAPPAVPTQPARTVLVEKAYPNLPDTTEPAPVAEDFAPDPLTRSRKGKRIWTEL